MLKKILTRFKIFIIILMVRCFGKKEFRFNKKNPRILIVTSTGMGDTLWATPVLQAIKKKYPNSYIGVLVNNLGKELLTHQKEWIDELFLTPQNFSFRWLYLLWTLRKKSFQRVLVFHASTRFVLALALLVKASQTVVYENRAKGLEFLFSKTLKEKKEHEVRKRFRLAKTINVPFLKTPLFYALDPSEQAWARKFLSPFENQLKVLIHPGAKDIYKCLPKSYYVDLISRFQKTNVRLFMSGTLEELPLIEEISSLCLTKPTLLIDLPIAKFAALMSFMDLLITQDTGPFHLAEALDLKTLAIFLPTDPKLSGPYYAPSITLLSKKPSCKICINRKCKSLSCWKKFSSEEIFFTAKKILEMKNSFS